MQGPYLLSHLGLGLSLPRGRVVFREGEREREPRAPLPRSAWILTCVVIASIPYLGSRKFQIVEWVTILFLGREIRGSFDTFIPLVPLKVQGITQYERL